MALTVSIGQAQALNGREAGLQATHQALNRLGSGTPALALSLPRINIRRVKLSAAYPACWVILQ